MTRDVKDWNYDRIHTAQAQMQDVLGDMMRCLHRGEVNDIVRERMVMRLRDAADDLARLKLCHKEETK